MTFFPIKSLCDVTEIQQRFCGAPFVLLLAIFSIFRQIISISKVKMGKLVFKSIKENFIKFWFFCLIAFNDLSLKTKSVYKKFYTS